MASVGKFIIAFNKIYLLNIICPGKGLCEELASRGQNIVLVSRTLSKLQTCAQEIEAKYKVKTKIIDIDFGSETQVLERIEAETKVSEQSCIEF